MGGGKGPIYITKAFLKPGSILLELYDIPFNLMFHLARVISAKISLKLKIITL